MKRRRIDDDDPIADERPKKKIKLDIQNIGEQVLKSKHKDFILGLIDEKNEHSCIRCYSKNKFQCKDIECDDCGLTVPSCKTHPWCKLCRINVICEGCYYPLKECDSCDIKYCFDHGKTINECNYCWKCHFQYTKFLKN